MHLKIFFITLFFALFLLNCKEEDKKALQKISPELRSALLDLNKTGDKQKRITVVFKVNEDLTDLHYEVLKRKKVKIIANIGPIFTASLPAEKVIDLAKMKFIDHIQGERTFKLTPVDTSKSESQFKESKK